MAWTVAFEGLIRKEKTYEDANTKAEALKMAREDGLEEFYEEIPEAEDWQPIDAWEE